ncbi:MAG: hypothetical protein JST79_00480 [Acidobacteria bacterium]|nr:hypothetical protein [Acidobacteriota bacterium]
MEFPVLPAILVSISSFVLGCLFFRTQTLAAAVLNWLIAFFFLLLCALDLIIQKNLWPSIILVLIAAICEAIFLYYWVAAYSRRNK